MFPELVDPRVFRGGIDDFVDVFVIEWATFLEQLFNPFLQLLNLFESMLLSSPWWLIVALVGAVAYAGARKWSLVALLCGAMLVMGFLGLWEDGMRTLALMLVCTLISILVGVPLGIFMSWSNRFRSMMLPVLDIMQTMPSFVYLIPAIMLFGPGKIPAVLATVIYAVPPLIRLTDLGIRMVDTEIMEAAESFGANRMQKLVWVQMPLALPNIMAGINQATMMALAMVVVASMIGAQGLGYQVLQGITRLEVGRGLLAGIAIVILAVVFDRITQAYGKRAQAHLHTNS
ncbi:ABC transporter permease [Marinobacterium rhizophilum]|uniref:Proline/glycine betaine ABC transporter permease n=1 Tax=Marinobacterium rhizophilum TaxID=420402 RepID=A0ABY5HQ91_9GAMM|nr:proline/glycine betaine ABC transporter permease [Marinobacterium rhizophilum]UTW13056.1 proline/glycine betaine ABC transporter permease [Marinobacterium rhizophilum]